MGRIYFAIVNRGKANALMKHAEKLGVLEGTILLGEGTVRSKLLEELGLNHTQKEVVMMPVTKEQDELLHKEISEKFKFNERNQGIGFSVPFMRWQKDSDSFSLDEDVFEYSLIMSIVEEGRSGDIIKVARRAKARGGTVIHGRGAGVPKDYYFPIQVEPQKDTVLIVVHNKKAQEIQDSIAKSLEEEKTGIVFSLPVVKTSGIFEDRVEEKLNKVKGGSA